MSRRTTAHTSTGRQRTETGMLQPDTLRCLLKVAATLPSGPRCRKIGQRGRDRNATSKMKSYLILNANEYGNWRLDSPCAMSRPQCSIPRYCRCTMRPSSSSPRCSSLIVPIRVPPAVAQSYEVRARPLPSKSTRRPRASQRLAGPERNRGGCGNRERRSLAAAHCSRLRHRSRCFRTALRYGAGSASTGRGTVRDRSACAAGRGCPSRARFACGKPSGCRRSECSRDSTGW